LVCESRILLRVWPIVLEPIQLWFRRVN
jgi:hypothetical protein